MTDDARFEDGREAPLNLGAMDVEDLQILSTLAQDSVLPASEMRWDSRARRFALLLNRPRREVAQQGRHSPERVQSLLVVREVRQVASQGVPRGDGDVVLSLLALKFEQTDAPSGSLTLMLAGDGAIRLDVEALDVTLRDVTRPYAAPSGKMPHHDV